MPFSVIVGRLKEIDRNVIVLSGSMRLVLAPDVDVSGFPIGTSLTVTAAMLDGVLVAQEIRQTPDEPPLGEQTLTGQPSA
jgi:hypothetical protein